MENLQQLTKLYSKRELESLLLEQKRRRGMRDLHFFCTNILGYTDLTDKDGFHGEFCDHLVDPYYKFKLALTPRGSLKSSIGTIGHTLQLITKDRDLRVLIASEKFTISTKFLAEIKGHIEHNDEFIRLYGDLKKGSSKWTESEIIVAGRTRYRKESTVSCAGIDVTKVGMHYDRIKEDDPHSDQNTGNQDQIDKVIRWQKLLYSLLDPGGWLDINGTIWHFNDVYNYIINKERERAEAGRKPRYKIFKRDSFEGTQQQLLDDEITEDKLLWPERLTAEFLKDQLIEQGPYIFSCQYRLAPVDDETAMFKRSWIKTCTWDQVPERLNYYSVVDAMVDEEGKDYLAIVTVGVDTNWLIYILDVRRLKADEHDTVDEMASVYDDWQPIRMGMESYVFQESYNKYIKLLQVMRGLRLPITELKTSTKISKRLRIKGMVPYWKAGLFIIPCKEGRLENLKGGMAVLIDELTRYPRTSNEDTIDALAWVNQLTQRPGVLHILKKVHPKSFKAVQDKLRKPKRKVLGARNVRQRHYVR